MKLRQIWVNRSLNSVRFGQPDMESQPAFQTIFPRSLDAELKAHAKSAESGWEWQKLSFVLESQGLLQDSEINKAQSRINSALQNSLQCGFSLFQTNLANDQLLHRRWVLASSGDEAKARTAVVASLEALG